MKKRNVLTVVLMLMTFIATTTYAKKENGMTWYSVKTMYANTRALTVTKVEFSDTATTLYIHSRYMPKYWIRISSKSCLEDGQGNRYALKSAEGITPDEKFWMPESGEHAFVMHFSPLPSETKMFDFCEGDDEGDWKLFGIHDGGTRIDLGIPEELKKMRYTGNETLPATTFRPGKARITCKVYGYRPAMGMEMRVLYSVIGQMEMKKADVPVGDDGTVTVEVALDMPTPLSIGIENVCYTTVYAVPGEEISFAMDPSFGDGTCFFGFTGRLARTHYEIANDTGGMHAIVTGNHQAMTDGMRGRSAEECAAFLNTMLKAQIDSINSRDLTDASKQILRMAAEDEQVEWRCYFVRKWRNSVFNLNSRSIKTEEDYNRVMESNPAPDIKGELMQDFPDMECLNSDHALFGKTLLAYSETGKKLPITNEYNRQLALTHACMCDAAELSEAEEASITDGNLKSMIAGKRERDRQLQEELTRSDNTFFKTYDDVKPEDILSTILKKYEGKAVFVDIWATWCGPCRNGHKMMVPLKEELKGRDVVFVYITSPSSPVDTWKKMIDDIPGEHYYLTKEQYGYILNKYESDGIPTYLLFDRQGNLTYKNIGFAGNDKFRKEIGKAME